MTLPFDKPVVGRPAKRLPQEQTTTTVKDAVPYTPLLVTDHMSPAQLQELVEKVRIGGMKAIDAALGSLPERDPKMNVSPNPRA